jgi:hypothetical protein
VLTAAAGDTSANDTLCDSQGIELFLRMPTEVSIPDADFEMRARELRFL